MDNDNKQIDQLRTILDNLHQPENLNDHPWVDSYMVKDELTRNPALKSLSPGARLVLTISNLFIKLIPDSPPKEGLRLDNRWGEFGIIASQYFAPLTFNYPPPYTLRDAWIGIDKAIELYIRNYREIDDDGELENYRLISDENGVAPNSTISDWHRKGIEKFAEFLINTERQIKINHLMDSSRKEDQTPTPTRKIINKRKIRTIISRILLITVILTAGLGIWYGYQVYSKVSVIKSHVDELTAITDNQLEDFLLDQGEISDTGEVLSDLRTDLIDLKDSAAPLLNLSPKLGWLPKYGGDISQAPLFLEMAIQGSIAGDEILTALTPVIESYNNGPTNSINVLSLITQLNDADAQLVAAQVALSNLENARQQIDIENLSPTIAQLLLERFDPAFAAINAVFPATEVLQMARLAPRLLGAVGNGFQSYMILIQNEDELRPTGGFLTAVGLVQVENGKITNMSVQSSDTVDDLSQPYPKTPWQLDDYMMAEIFLFRDANWYTDFPTTVDWAKFLYSYTQPIKIDGVIAIDQHVVQQLLSITGPIKIEGEEQPISADNVLTYMRSAKENTPPEGVARADWDRKQFIERMATALLARLLKLESNKLPAMAQQVIDLLDEKHILMQFSDPEMSDLIAMRNWDGAVKPDANSDFLMIVDSNVGFNKTNVNTHSEIIYEVDLQNPNQPTADLTISIQNNANTPAEFSGYCIQAGGDIRDLPLDQREYIMDDCYWTYLRVYTPEGATLLSSTPQVIPQPWPLREKVIPARVDQLDENISGVDTFGTLLVIPPGESYSMQYQMQLPQSVLAAGSDQEDAVTYTLKIQKQPGTIDTPMMVNARIPQGATMVAMPDDFSLNNNTLTWSGFLSTDLSFSFTFSTIE